MTINIRDHIRIIPGFPKPGINFYDIATLLAHPAAWEAAVEQMAAKIAPYRPEMLVGIESRGFLVAAPLALKLGCGFAMVRKKGKLPGQTLAQSYDLEYGSDTIEIQPDLFPQGARVGVVDDLLATGGTMAATESLIAKAGAQVVAHGCIIALDGLNGEQRLKAPFFSLLRCPA